MTLSYLGHEHECEPSRNPRFKHTCAICGQRMPRTETRQRNIKFERDVTLEAAKGVCEPSALIEFSEARAAGLSGKYVDDPSQVLVGRDRLRDAREELSDCRNHLVWYLEENIGQPGAQDKLIALRFVLLAYDRLLEADD